MQCENPLLTSKCLKLSTKGWSINERMLQLDTGSVSYYTNNDLSLKRMNSTQSHPRKSAPISAILTVKALSDREDRKQIKRFGTLPSDQTFKIIFKRTVSQIEST